MEFKLKKYSHHLKGRKKVKQLIEELELKLLFDKILYILINMGNNS